MKIKRPRGTGRIFQRGSIWWIKYHRNGKAYRESSQSTERGTAEKLLRSRLGEIADDRFVGLAPKKVTVGDLIDLVAEDYRITGKRSIKDLEWRADKHLRPRFGKLKASQFGSLQIKRYINDRRVESASDATINRELAILQRGFTLACQADPPLIIRAPHFPKLDLDNARSGFIEESQYLALLEALPDHLKCLLVVGYHCGNRLGELRRLEWPMVDFAAREIRIPAKLAKNKKGRVVPIYGDMALWLQKQWEEREYADGMKSRRVFHWHGKPIGAHIKGWAAACESVGLDGLHFHDLRRSAVRNMERANVPRKMATEITGHKTESVYRRYDIVSRRDLRSAATKLENYHQEQRLGTIEPNLGTERKDENRPN